MTDARVFSAPSPSANNISPQHKFNTRRCITALLYFHCMVDEVTSRCLRTFPRESLKQICDRFSLMASTTFQPKYLWHVENIVVLHVAVSGMYLLSVSELYRLLAGNRGVCVSFAVSLGALVSVRPPPSPSLSSQDSQLEADVFAHDKLKTSLLKTELQQFKMQQM